MTNLTRAGAANILQNYITNTLFPRLDLSSDYAAIAKAGGWSAQAYPPSFNGFLMLPTGKARGPSVVAMAQAMVTHYARIKQLMFTRTGKWSLTADPNRTNQGSTVKARESAKPRPGTVEGEVAYVTNLSPTQANLTPTTTKGYTIFNPGEVASMTAFTLLAQNLAQRLNANVTINSLGVNFCHTSCHNNCHSSRGRR